MLKMRCIFFDVIVRFQPVREQSIGIDTFECTMS